MDFLFCGLMQKCPVIDLYQKPEVFLREENKNNEQFRFCTLDMAQLLVIPPRLHVLSSKLKRDRDIQKQINDIARKARTAAESFKSAISKEGSAVLLQKTLFITSSSNDISIADMQRALNAATQALTATSDIVVSLQRDIHSSIEICRGRKGHYESELDTILSRISNMWTEIESLEVIITIHEDEATSLSVEAVELNKRVYDMKKAAKKKRKHVETTGLIGGIVGLALAPFTGGTSLALATAATGISAAVNLPRADTYEKTASRLHNDAERKTVKVEELTSQKSELMKQKSSLESEMGPVQSRTESLTEASNVLQQVTSFLLPTIHAIDVLLHAFQDMSTAIEDASLQNNSFEIIRLAFSSTPKRIEGRSSPYLDRLMEKWEQLEGILLQHGAQNFQLK
ncbi:uncharacterized protein LOC123547256 [Mercenaria mercenaria]|uniref:uncharacterized protein LOC123547256 n=1 Tax=Mercenaria mercenaria TaxID=6596 RepID=UPI00234EE334|nr:uncharacterized protein LOC123547256 [Mercenaria mercenaria]